MKEATGELNMTVVTVVAIAAVGAFFYAFIWPGIQTGLARNTCSNMCPTQSNLTDEEFSGKISVNLKEKTCTCPDGTVMNYKDGTSS